MMKLRKTESGRYFRILTKTSGLRRRTVSELAVRGPVVLARVVIWSMIWWFNYWDSDSLSTSRFMVFQKARSQKYSLST